MAVLGLDPELILPHRESPLAVSRGRCLSFGTVSSTRIEPRCRSAILCSRLRTQAMGSPSGGCPSGTPPSTNACLIDFSLADAGTNPKGGYIFTASATNTSPGIAFVEGASPSVPGRTGVKSFCGSDDGVVRYNPNGGPVTACCSTLSMIGN